AELTAKDPSQSDPMFKLFDKVQATDLPVIALVEGDQIITNYELVIIWSGKDLDLTKNKKNISLVLLLTRLPAKSPTPPTALSTLPPSLDSSAYQSRQYGH
ncbi:MAG: hypothetical protein ACRDEA_06645, partial [Microcystaceae cyanobacterium]